MVNDLQGKVPTGHIPDRSPAHHGGNHRLWRSRTKTSWPLSGAGLTVDAEFDTMPPVRIFLMLRGRWDLTEKTVLVTGLAAPI